jgi:hypothetical protein
VAPNSRSTQRYRGSIRIGKRRTGGDGVMTRWSHGAPGTLRGP